MGRGGRSRLAAAATLSVVTIATSIVAACGGSPPPATTPRAAAPTAATTSEGLALPTSLPPVTLAGEQPAAPDLLPPGSVPALGPWRFVGRGDVFGIASDQGLATVRRPDGTTAVVYRGGVDVTATLRSQGWTHIGDPGGWQGWVVDAFQGRLDAKMFRATGPAGQVVEAVHPLTPGEAFNNSFVAVDPSGARMVAGEWDIERRLLVFATPGVTGATQPPSALALQGTIALDHPARDVQGCDFADATTLVCATADPGTDLWPGPDQVLEIRLSNPLTETPDPSGTVTMLGTVPTISGCTGPYEPEGVDVDRAAGRLRLAVVAPGQCAAATQIYEYRQA